jgi:hypothetical protein
MRGDVIAILYFFFRRYPGNLDLTGSLSIRVDNINPIHYRKMYIRSDVSDIEEKEVLVI